MNFHDLNLNKAILRTLEELGLTTPTPIQIQAIPPVLEGKDVVGLAQTGTGKTAAFLLPLLQRQIRDNHKGKFRPIRVLVLSPTRELAAQIFEKARDYGQSLNLRSQCAVGGVPINRQIKAHARGADILIATPGRLLDLSKRRSINLDSVECVVLDEADHMLDIGFLPDIRRIFGQLPAERQTLLFSATMPPAIRQLADQYLKDPVQISVARDSAVAENIEQSVKHVSSGQKTDELISLLQQNMDKRVVVFARTKSGSDRLVRRLTAVKIDAAAIHGNKSQSQRERALKAFTRGDCNILIATDIASRGIDIKDVALVVNYDLPPVPEVYVHRIGRTARAGSSGVAVAFCAPDEVKHLRSIERLIKLQIPSEGKFTEPKGGDRKKSGGKSSSGQRRKPNNRPQHQNKSSDNNRFAKKSSGHSSDREGDQEGYQSSRPTSAPADSRGNSRGKPYSQGGKPGGRKPYSPDGARQGDARQGETRQGESRQGERRYGGEKRSDGRRFEGRRDEGKNSDARRGESRRNEPRHGDTRRGEPRQNEGRQGEGRQGEGRQGDFRRGGPRREESRQGDSRQGETRHADSRQANDGRSSDRPNKAKFSKSKSGKSNPNKGKPNKGKSSYNKSDSSYSSRDNSGAGKPQGKRPFKGKGAGASRPNR